MKLPNWFAKAGALGLITAAIAAVGVIKTVVELGSGESFSIQQVAYFLGASAFAVYIAIVICIIAATIVMIPLSYLTGHGDDPPDALTALGFGVGAILGVYTIYLLMTADTLTDYDGTDGLGRAFMAAVGIAAVAGGIYLARKWQQEASQQPQSH